MNRHTFFRRVLVFLGAILVIIVLAIYIMLISMSSGSQFVLAEDSKLPVWFKNESNIPREKIEVQIAMAGLFPDKIKIAILSEDKVIERAKGTWRWHPASLKKHKHTTGPPNWIIININGTEEVYEQRERNNIQRIVSEDEVMATTSQ
jgi:hypothetical protein